MNYSSIFNKKILISCLDWGFGHVTRSIGIISELLKQDNQFYIAGNQQQIVIFKSYFPELEFIDLDGYNFIFSGSKNWTKEMWKNRKTVLNAIKKEKKFVEQICMNHQIDFVLSDHRYGFYSKNVPSIFITHQLNLPLSKFYFFVQKWHERQLRKFNIIWVLDDENNFFAGKLSRKIKHPSLEYIGIKSRLQKKEYLEKKYDFLIVISGPKPYSEYLFKEILSKIDLSNKQVAVLHPKSIQITAPSQNFHLYPSENLKEADRLFYESEIIISRSGYSTIMDLKILNKKGILIPTPGQKEQEYLAEIHKFN